ncbi:hypothetical protein [Alkalihalobacillus sp. LMS39]|uniref:hypothetical protein n=1 Tax=Alkalihalobacillus sp. LMS39 TaxID=2924032 RepID=UPI001FB20D01|nr:hypothetical protein [Alkalihalobacillus sp. LMS39]UOE94549.1 hypothetical protein MM271_02455 [Alkalihalobacillus sp. LMS39]
MKVLVQGAIFSVIVHFVFVVSTLAYGFLVTMFHKPEVINEYNEVSYLQNEVAFGVTYQPIYFVVSFIVITLIGAILIKLIKKARLFKRFRKN